MKKRERMKSREQGYGVGWNGDTSSGNRNGGRADAENLLDLMV